MDHSKRHRKLNLNAPIMSTRRFGSVVADTSSSLGTFQNTSERVPFSWEKEPGKPKDTERNGSKIAPCHRLFPLLVSFLGRNVLYLCTKVVDRIK